MAIRRWLVYFWWALIALLAFSVVSTTPAFARSAPERLVLAFYYTWFNPDVFTPSQVADIPVTPYHSDDRGAIERHVDQAKSAGIDALVSAWIGPGNPTDSNFATLLDVAQQKGFRATIYFETHNYTSQAQAVTALRYLQDKYSGHPAFLRHNGKPVYMFWNLNAVPKAPGQSALDAWRSIRAQVDPNNQAVWIAEGVDINFQNAFDGHHLFSIAWSGNLSYTLGSWQKRVNDFNTRTGAQKLWVATVMPGYDDIRTGRGDGFSVNRRGGDYYRATWDAALGTDPDWVIITSFNEWVEGSQIEPSVTYGNLYLDLTREYSRRFKAGPAPAPAPAAAPSGGGDSGIVRAMSANESRYFPETGYRVGNDAFWDFYNKRGGLRAFGYPVSRQFKLLASDVQVFQRAVMQLHGDGSVTTLNLLDGDYMPFTRVNGSAYPCLDQQLLAAAPAPGGADYAARVQDYVKGHAPDAWDGAPTGFYRTFTGTVSAKDAYPRGGGDPAQLPLLNLEVWGVPTSSPTRDPNNGNFVYLRYQRGIMQFDQSSGSTQGLLLGDYFKSILTGQNLPADLAEDAASSRFLRQYDNNAERGLVRPDLLPDSNLKGAFERE